jgi:hypothetical protein
MAFRDFTAPRNRTPSPPLPPATLLHALAIVLA